MIVRRQLDSRVTELKQARKMLPLDEVSFSPEDDSRSLVSTLSEDKDDLSLLVVGKESQAIRHCALLEKTSRSIFSNYWKADGGCAARFPPAAQCISNPPRVQGRRIIMHNVDPYEHFGLTGDCGEEKSGEDSVNTYERILQSDEKAAQRAAASFANRNPFESRPLWLTAFLAAGAGINSSTSAPSLGRQGTNADYQARRGVLSDSALLKTPKKSCLRRGRFACGNSSAIESTVATTTELSEQERREPNDRQQNEVSFEPRVEVYIFQPPVETWAPKGWSNWFG